MIKRILVVIFLVIISLHSTVVSAKDFKHVQIFDPKQNKVVKAVQVNEDINNMVVSWVNGIHGVYGKNDPVKDDGYAVKIPLDPSIKVQTKSLIAIVDEVYVIIPKSNPPFLMIFENKDKLTCFPFYGDIDKLSKILDFNLKGKLG